MFMYTHSLPLSLRSLLSLLLLVTVDDQHLLG